MKIDLSVEGIPELVGRFARVRQNLSDFRGATWIRVRQAFYKVQRSVFATEGADSAGGKWAPLSPAYKKVKDRRYGAVPILQANGQMYREFTATPAGIDEGPQEMTMRFSPPAGFHAAGTSRMPRRDPTDLTDAQKADIVEPIKLRLRQIIDNEKLSSLRGS